MNFLPFDKIFKDGGGGEGGIGSIDNAEGGREIKKFKNHCFRVTNFTGRMH